MTLWSLPVRERGLKWIDLLLPACVYLSLPVRERGLKYPEDIISLIGVTVAPRAGAWIEIVLVCVNYAAMSSRSPCGSVD